MMKRKQVKREPEPHDAMSGFSLGQLLLALGQRALPLGSLLAVCSQLDFLSL